MAKPIIATYLFNKEHQLTQREKVHSTPALNQNATPLGPEVQAGNPLSAYDGAAVIEVASFEVFSAAFQDEYYKTVIAEDEKKFLDKSAGVLRTRGEAKKIVKMI